MTSFTLFTQSPHFQRFLDWLLADEELETKRFRTAINKATTLGELGDLKGYLRHIDATKQWIQARILEEKSDAQSQATDHSDPSSGTSDGPRILGHTPRHRRTR